MESDEEECGGEAIESVTLTITSIDNNTHYFALCNDQW